MPVATTVTSLMTVSDVQNWSLGVKIVMGVGLPAGGPGFTPGGSVPRLISVKYSANACGSGCCGFDPHQAPLDTGPLN